MMQPRSAGCLTRRNPTYASPDQLPGSLDIVANTSEIWKRSLPNRTKLIKKQMAIDKKSGATGAEVIYSRKHVVACSLCNLFVNNRKHLMFVQYEI